TAHSRRWGYIISEENRQWSCLPIGSMREPAASARSLQGAIEHPLHAEPVRKLPVVIAPGLDAERSRHPSPTSHSLDQQSRSLAIPHHEDVRRAPHRLGIIVVGGEEENAWSFELCVHDLATHRFALCGHAVLAVAQNFDDLAQAAFSVEREGVFACRRDEQAVRKLYRHRRASACSPKQPERVPEA